MWAALSAGHSLGFKQLSVFASSCVTSGKLEYLAEPSMKHAHLVRML